MLNKKDFLAGICGDNVEFSIPNVGNVMLRSLTVKELKTIANDYKTDDIGAATATLLYGMVEPKLDKSDLEALESAIPGIIMNISKRISELSGLNDTQDTNSPN